MSRRRIVTLTTDFGLHDPYAGQMKGAIYSLAGDVEVVDITHEIAAQSVVEAAFVIETSWRYFPEGSIHVVVVDPGVGTSRQRLVVSSGGHTFVGPDNGCLSAAFPAYLRPIRDRTGNYEADNAALPRTVDARLIERLELLPREPSATFEGRDVFGPVAALLAGGLAPAALGAAPTSAMVLPQFRAPSFGNEVFGVVLRVDRFGSLITDIRAEDARGVVRVDVADRELPIARTYTEAGGPAALIGSTGYLEVALPNGSAALALGLGPGARVVCFADR